MAMNIPRDKIVLTEVLADASLNSIYATVYLCQINQNASYFLAHSFIHSIGYVVVFSCEIISYLTELYLFIYKEQKSRQETLEFSARSFRFAIIAVALSVLPVFTVATPVLYMVSMGLHMVQMAATSVYDVYKEDKPALMLHSGLAVADAYMLFAAVALLVLQWHNPVIAVGAGLLCLVAAAFSLSEVFKEKVKVDDADGGSHSENRSLLFPVGGIAGEPASRTSARTPAFS